MERPQGPPGWTPVAGPSWMDSSCRVRPAAIKSQRPTAKGGALTLRCGPPVASRTAGAALVTAAGASASARLTSDYGLWASSGALVGSRKTQPSSQ
jgi:hypothetical protein